MEAPARLDKATLATMVTELAGLRWDGAAADTASPADLTDLLRQLENLKNAAAAAQARIIVELRRIRQDEARAAGRDVRRVAASVAGEVGLARRESPHRAVQLVGLAKVLTEEMPHTMKAFTAGEVSEYRASLLARETACISQEDRARVDAHLGPRLGGLSDRQVVAQAHDAAYRLDPFSVVERVARAEADRRVTIRPAPDCMAQVTALLPVAQGVSVYAALVREADSARASGDARTRGQVMADTLVARATGQETATGMAVEVQLVMTDRALFGDTDTPARLTGYGPIPAAVARRLASIATGKGRAWVRRLYTRPDTGRLVAMESKRRCFPAALKQLIAVRDEVCRTPWCGAPIRHADHIDPVRSDGATTFENGQGLCERCNQLKEHPGWRARPGPDGAVVTTTPTGHEYTSEPPPLPRDPPFTPVRRHAA